MRRILPAAAIGAFSVACSPAPPPAMIFPHEASRIEGVCVPGRATSALGVATLEPFPGNGVRRFRIINTTASPREVHPDFVSQDAGPCEVPFARSERFDLEDTGSCEPAGTTTLAPGASLEVRLSPRPLRLRSPCTKIGLALQMHVDGEPACVELGAWIAYRPPED
jgi:hypothetical protein